MQTGRIISVIGLCYVGLPEAVAFGKVHPVLIDVNGLCPREAMQAVGIRIWTL